MKKERYDHEWRKSRIAARILLKKETARPLSARDVRLARLFAEDRGVTNRLIDQAISSLRGRKFQKEREKQQHHARPQQAVAA